MGKILIVFFVVVFFMMFASRNFDHVVLRFVFGNPLQIPLILVIMGSFVVGYATALFSFMLYLSNKKKNNR